MNSTELHFDLIASINKLLESRGEKKLHLDSVLFAIATDVVFNEVCTVAKCYGPVSVKAILEEKARPGPSWIHASLVRGATGTNLVVLEFGANVGNPQPTINVSYENRGILLQTACV
jgi:hypothetical protein